MKTRIENWPEDKIKRRTFFSFASFLAFGTAAVGLWRWFRKQPPVQENLSETTREILGINEKVNASFFDEQHLAPVYPQAMAAKNARINGNIGLQSTLDLAEWRLEINKADNTEKLFLTLDDIKTLPKQEIVFDFKCVEGWNQIVHYGGVRFADLIKKHGLGTNPSTNTLFKYVGLATPDDKYYVGMDMKSMLHSQTLLCFELNGQPLSDKHGAPLRLISPLKYGVKNLKRIGKIYFTDTPPPDFWHQQGYDYDLAL